MLLSLATALLLTFTQAGAPAAAQPTPVAEAKVSPAGLKAGERKMKVICRDETVTGSRMSKRRCISAADFARREEDARASFAAMQGVHNLPATKGN